MEFLRAPSETAGVWESLSACVHACMHACVCACVRLCAFVSACVLLQLKISFSQMQFVPSCRKSQWTFLARHANYKAARRRKCWSVARRSKRVNTLKHRTHLFFCRCISSSRKHILFTFQTTSRRRCSGRGRGWRWGREGGGRLTG